MAVEILVHGRVQGVFFRANTKIQASQLEIKGFVKNLDTGQVFIHAEGNKLKIEKFIKWCRKGTEPAIVEHLEIEEVPDKSYSGFVIK